MSLIPAWNTVFRYPEVGSGRELLSTALSQPDEVYRNGRDAVHVLKRVGWMRVEPQQRNPHPSEEDQGGSMNLPTSVEERVKQAMTETRIASIGQGEQLNHRA